MKQQSTRVLLFLIDSWVIIGLWKSKWDYADPFCHRPMSTRPWILVSHTVNSPTLQEHRLKTRLTM